ncbi:helix-turn-helix domain-containing protein, partial [Rhodovulum sp.]|uniref:helix-turn-helix domain-containing protein n=1 Tax=Rhodovulum sp. TaxID=34009 RepID=UPI0018311ACE
EAAHVETVPADKMLWHDDAPPSAVGIVVSGYLRFQRHSRDGTGLISLAVARRDIADLLATSVETICRVFKTLERDGLIRLLDPAHILFLDIDALAERTDLTDGEVPCAPGPVGPKPGLAHGPMTLINASSAGEPLVSVLPAWRGGRPD